MRKTSFTYQLIVWLGVAACCVSCEKDFDIELQPARPVLVVEGYINNLMPAYNYVVLSRSQDYYAPNFESVPVSGASISITEGEFLPDQTIAWDPSSRVVLTESNNPLIPEIFRRGVYFDQRLFSNPSQAIIGRPGKAYLLDITHEGKQYSAVTRLLQPVAIDSLTAGFAFTDEDGNEKLRMTNHYQDPDTIGNRQMYFWTNRDNRNSFGWGAITRSRAPGTDDLVNGEYIRLTHPQGFDRGDTLSYMMASVTADTWNFWDSFNKARSSDEGPFASPASLKSTIRGTDVVGCFSGFSLSADSLIMR